MKVTLRRPAWKNTPTSPADSEAGAWLRRLPACAYASNVTGLSCGTPAISHVMHCVEIYVHAAVDGSTIDMIELGCSSKNGRYESIVR